MSTDTDQNRANEEGGHGFPLELKLLLGVIAGGVLWMLIRASGLV